MYDMYEKMDKKELLNRAVTGQTMRGSDCVLSFSAQYINLTLNLIFIFDRICALEG